MSSKDASVYRIKPFEYVHVIDNNTGVTSVVVGPATFTRQDHQKVVQEPQAMVIIPPRHYCIISNPVVRKDNGEPATDSHGNYKLKHGDEEIRFAEGVFSDPFPLFPGERLYGKVNPLQVVAPDSALRLRAMRDFPDGKQRRVAGDEWLFIGPGTYIPKIEVQVVEIIRAHLIKPTEALLLRARRECTDVSGTVRKAGEEWLMRASGAYLPLVDEEFVEKREAKILTDQTALHFRAKRTYKDVFGHQRKAGEEWLVTSRECESYIQDVHEVFVTDVPITTLNNRQYCIVLDPVGGDGKPQFGKKELRRGPQQFFLQPGERLEKSIQNVNVLSEHESLLLTAKEECVDDEGAHKPGERWMVVGPCEYVPPLAVDVVEKRFKIPLDANEGIYVRDINTGKIRAEIGASYMLQPNEELWEKELPDTVETLLATANAATEARDKTRVVSLRVPHNAAVQIYDYKEKCSRVQFGPNLVILGPDEQFTVLSLSGGKPKRPHVIKALNLLLGPDFMTDIVTVETSDHARLQLKLSYNWFFDITDKTSQVEGAKIFCVPDFVGDTCKAVASRVRGAVAAVPFDDFHRHSARIIRSAVFGIDAHGKVFDRFHFTANNVVITNIDIQSVEPVDQRTRDSLQKSVQLAIEITTKSQEANARHEAERQEQEARGALERQRIKDERACEEAKKHLLELQAHCAMIENSGQATADATARAKSCAIEAQSEVDLARLRAEASTLADTADLEQTVLRQNAEIDHQRALDSLEIKRTEHLAKIEANKFKAIITAIGPDTIAAIARAGPEMQAKLLSGLGLKSLMITDGHSPINLFNTAQGLLNGSATATAGNL
jgi:major vault protein